MSFCIQKYDYGLCINLFIFPSHRFPNRSFSWCILFFMTCLHQNKHRLFQNEQTSLYMILFGLTSQCCGTLPFFYQRQFGFQIKHIAKFLITHKPFSCCKVSYSRTAVLLAFRGAISLIEYSMVGSDKSKFTVFFGHLMT